MMGFDIVYLLMIFLGAVFAAALYVVNGFVFVKDSIKNKAKAAGVFALSVLLAVPTAFALNYLLHPIAWGDRFANLTGLAFHTLYTTGFLLIYAGIFLLITRLNTTKYLNAAVPSLALFIAIGKIGCVVAGCCGGVAIGNFIFPTAIVESAAGFLLFFVFQFFIKTSRLPKYLMIYGTFRFLIEFLRARTYSIMIYDIIKPEQIISLMMAAAGFVIAQKSRRKKIF